VFFLVVGRVENHLNRNIKMKAAKMVKTKGLIKKEVIVCSNKCRELDIFFCV
jgi:hypothetical protein